MRALRLLTVLVYVGFVATMGLAELLTALGAVRLLALAGLGVVR